MEKKHVEAERPDQKGGMPFQLFLETMTRNWNQLCSSLPLSIAGLGDLANASTVMERDFTIKDQQPEGRLSRFLLNPQCFALFVWRVIHASKMAVNSACTSMNEFTTLTGHVLFCMQKIPLNSQQTVSQPDGLCVAKEMKIIEPGHTLSLVRKCQGSADETRTAFEHLGDLVAKVVNVCDPSKNGGPKLLRRQIETYEDFLKTWRSHQDKIGAELHKNFLRSSRHLYDTRAAFREVRKGYPGWLQYLDASLCDHLESLFSPLDREGNMSIKLLFSTYDAKLHCAYDQLCFAEKKFEEEYDKSDAWFDREKRLPHILQKQSSMNEIDPQPALELLEKAHADLDSLKKLTIQLMDYCELLMDAIRTPDKEDQTTRPTEIEPIIESFRFVHSIATTFCKVWNDHFLSSFDQMESLIGEWNSSIRDPVETRAIHYEFHALAKTASVLLRKSTTAQHHQMGSSLLFKAGEEDQQEDQQESSFFKNQN